MDLIVISSDESEREAAMESGWDAGCESVDEFDEDEVQGMRERGKAFLESSKNLQDELRMGLEGKEWKKIEAN